MKREARGLGTTKDRRGMSEEGWVVKGKRTDNMKFADKL